MPAARPVPDAAAQRIARDLLLLTFCLGEELPHAPNGRPVAPSAYAAQVMKDMKQERSHEFTRIMAVLMDRVRSGVPLDVACLVLDRMRAALEAVAASERRGRALDRPITFLSRLEQRADAALDDAQLQLGGHEDDPIVLERVAQRAAAHITAATALKEAAERRRAGLVLQDGGGRDAATPTRPSRGHAHLMVG